KTERAKTDQARQGLVLNLSVALGERRPRQLRQGGADAVELVMYGGETERDQVGQRRQRGRGTCAANHTLTFGWKIQACEISKMNNFVVNKPSDISWIEDGKVGQPPQLIRIVQLPTINSIEAF